MWIAEMVFSIRPGRMPAATAALAAAWAARPLAAQASATFLTEIGEVNTFTCLQEVHALDADLAALQRWLDGAAAGDLAPLLRGVTLQLLHSDDEPAALAALAAPGVRALLLQEFAADVGASPPGALGWRGVSGVHGRTWRCAVAVHVDDALALALRSAMDPSVPLVGSLLLKPALR